MKTFNYFIFLALVLMAWSCGSESKIDEKKSYTIVDSHRMIEDSAYYLIDCEFPTFVASDGDSSLEKLNIAITAFLDTAAVYYWGLPLDSVKPLIENSETAGSYVLNNKYTILDTTPERISLLMETYSYALGAHGFTALHTYNFDVNKNSLLEISDILDLSTEQNIQELNRLLLENFENPEQCFSQNPTADIDFVLFGISPEHLIFYYEAYELGAYSCGMATIKVPIQSLIETGLWKE